MPSHPLDPTAARRPLRVLTYSHDSFGLGHLRRSVTLASALVAAAPCAQVLCLTGSPVPDLFPLPERCDLVKLPSLGKNDAGEYVARRLPVSSGEITTLRSELVTATVRAFRPDLLLVDHTPIGPGGELLPVLRRLQNDALGTKLVLGLRDVLDTPLRARAELQRLGAVELLRSVYDHVLVYGERDVFDPVQEYGLPEAIAAKTTFTGPVVPEAARAVRVPLDPDEPHHVVVTTGGGEDGYGLLRAAVAALRGPLRDTALKITVVAGPLLAETSFTALQRAVHGDARFDLRRSTDAMHALLRSAHLAIGMGGYNTVYESLASGTPLLVLPRRRPREEQYERCRRLEARGHLRVLDEATLGDPHAMAAAVRASLTAALLTPPAQMRCEGADKAARTCLQLVCERGDRSRRPAQVGN